MRRSIRFASMLLSLALPAQSTIIGKIAVDKQSLNTATSDVVTLSVTFARPGIASVNVVDRDGFVARRLTISQPVHGATSVSWNGRDDNGNMVPDEAYSFKIDWSSGHLRETYFPAAKTTKIVSIPPRYYDRRNGTLSYVLPKSSRVHVQAGTAIFHGKDVEGPVLRTIVNREPRAAGAVAEHWNGFDESGSIFVPDLTNFVIAIVASPLPENSVITFGNRAMSYIDSLNSKRGASLLPPRTGEDHHAGLATADDVSPGLAIEPVNARWSPSERLWLTSSDTLQVRFTPAGKTAGSFERQPAKIYRFLNGRNAGQPLAKNASSTSITLNKSAAVQIVAINWVSDWGPVAANAVRIRRVSEKEAAR